MAFLRKKVDVFFEMPLDTSQKSATFASTIANQMANAKVAQLVERDLAKVEVAGSNPVFRSTNSAPTPRGFFVSSGITAPGWRNR